MLIEKKYICTVFRQICLNKPYVLLFQKRCKGRKNKLEGRMEPAGRTLAMYALFYCIDISWSYAPFRTDLFYSFRKSKFILNDCLVNTRIRK